MSTEYCKRLEERIIMLENQVRALQQQRIKSIINFEQRLNKFNDKIEKLQLSNEKIIRRIKSFNINEGLKGIQ